MSKPTNPEEAKQKIIDQLAGQQPAEPEEVKAEPEEVEEVKAEPEETPADEPEKKEEPEEVEEPEEALELEPEAPAEEPDTHTEKLQKKLVVLHKKYAEQKEALKAAEDQVAESMQILEIHVDSRMQGLTKEQRKLVEELAQTGTPLDIYKSLSLLDKHGVLSQKTTEHKAAVKVDKTRVASESAQNSRPSNPAEAKKNIVRQLRKMK